MAKLVTSGFGHTGGLSYIIVRHALPIMTVKMAVAAIALQSERGKERPSLAPFKLSFG